MNALLSYPQEQASPSASAASHVVFISEFSSGYETQTTSGNNDTDELTLRATKMTEVLKNILEHSCYTHGGLND